jgi:hypothetical protein
MTETQIEAMKAGRKAAAGKTRKESGHTVRTADGGTIQIANLSRGRAIKLFCTECLGWETHPKDCTATNCALFPFRGRTLAAYHKVSKGQTDSVL